jgi:hypothetical protein
MNAEKSMAVIRPLTSLVAWPLNVELVTKIRLGADSKLNPPPLWQKKRTKTQQLGLRQVIKGKSHSAEYSNSNNVCNDTYNSSITT